MSASKRKVLLFILTFNLKFKNTFPAAASPSERRFGKSCSASYSAGARVYRGCEPLGGECGVLELEGAISEADLAVLDSISGRTVDVAVPDGSTAFYDFASNALTHEQVFIKVILTHDRCRST